MADVVIDKQVFWERLSKLHTAWTVRALVHPATHTQSTSTAANTASLRVLLASTLCSAICSSLPDVATLDA